MSVSSTCSGVISGCPSRSASCCAPAIASCAFSVYFWIFMAPVLPSSFFRLLRPGLGLLDRLPCFSLFLRQGPRELDVDGRVEIAPPLRLPDMPPPLSLQPAPPPRPRPLRPPQST